ncbi:MAG: glycerol-3-phosphate dehydrogenase/oxidase [Pseudomonadota bacterium]
MSSALRDTNIDKLDDGTFDVFVVGAGINGAVSAAALAARGVRVAIVDAGDFAGLTSSQSSNLAWGGIKYLENQEFGLVWNLCKSRNTLMRAYPSTVKEARFLAAVPKGFRWPRFVLYLGALLYWAFGRFATRAPSYLSKSALIGREPVLRADATTGGMEYSDCYLYDNDARFVFNFVRAAMDSGAIAANYVRVTDAQRRDGVWQLALRDEETGREFTSRADVLVNACGPEADALNRITGHATAHRHVFSKGIHLIVDRVTDSRRILTSFASDGRLYFAIPMGARTCIGTTDTRVDSWHTEVSEADRQFVLDNANHLLKLDEPLTRDDIISERCGVRPLAVKSLTNDATDWLELSRKHAIDIDREQRQLTIFGGKLTDCLNVGDEICDTVAELGVAVPYAEQIWYGEPPTATHQEFLRQARLMDLDSYTHPNSTEPLTMRFWRRYGANAIGMLERIRENPQMVEPLMRNTDYLRCEVEYTQRREMVTQLDDFLRRRSKITMVVRESEVIAAPGLTEACRILFGEQADAKLKEYLARADVSVDADSPLAARAADRLAS